MFKFVKIFALIAVASAEHFGYHSHDQPAIQHGFPAFSHHSLTHHHSPVVPVYHSAPIHHHHHADPVHHEPIHFSTSQLHSHHAVPSHSAQSHGHDFHGAHGEYHHHH